MDKAKIIELLKDEVLSDVERFAAYCIRLKFEKDKSGYLKNAWFQKKTEEQMSVLFLRVKAEGLVFDGIHVTIQSTGVSYDYVAYRNKMLTIYPESKIDISLVYEGDAFKFRKESGAVIYDHSFKDPFNNPDDEIIGGYMVVKNKRGEFITLLSRADFEKHRKVARTDFIWAGWYPEMCKKTIAKKGFSDHFEDLYTGINSMDNENYDLDKPIRTEIDEISLKLVDAFDLYQGDDIEALRTMCMEKRNSGQFDVSFAKNILKQIS